MKTQRLSEYAKLPKYAHDGDAGLDLYASESTKISYGEITVVSTGIAVEIPRGYVGLIHPRSGLAADHGVTVVNAPGTIDSGYRGEVKVIMTTLKQGEEVPVAPGMKIAQLVIQAVERADIVETNNLTKSARGTGGFGSTGVV